jgi:hypothetical protein
MQYIARKKARKNKIDEKIYGNISQYTYKLPATNGQNIFPILTLEVLYHIIAPIFFGCNFASNEPIAGLIDPYQIGKNGIIKNTAHIQGFTQKIKNDIHNAASQNNIILFSCKYFLTKFIQIA